MGTTSILDLSLNWRNLFEFRAILNQALQYEYHAIAYLISILTMSLFWFFFQIWIKQPYASLPTHNIFCQIFKQGFADLSSLNTHYNIAHAPPKTITTPSFFCRICKKGYKDKTTLAAHEFSMHGLGQAPRKCRFCEARFVNSSQLKKHMGLNHKDHA